MSDLGAAIEVPQEAVEAVAKAWLFHVQTWAEQRVMARGALEAALPALLAAGWLPPHALEQVVSPADLTFSSTHSGEPVLSQGVPVYRLTPTTRK